MVISVPDGSWVKAAESGSQLLRNGAPPSFTAAANSKLSNKCMLRAYGFNVGKALRRKPQVPDRVLRGPCHESLQTQGLTERGSGITPGSKKY